jgi:hypothetical protein
MGNLVEKYKEGNSNITLSLINIKLTSTYQGHLYILECKEFLVKRGLPLVVSISEDATRILSKVEFDPKTNSLVGLVGKLDDNGLPMKIAFPADTPELFVKYFDLHNKANNAILIMAQSVQPGDF